MTHEYGDPFDETAIASAAARAVELKRGSPALPLEAAAERAVHEHVCSCAIAIEDQVEHRRSGLHASIVQQVVELAREASQERRSDVVDEASRESFPASDPPSWIWNRPGQ